MKTEREREINIRDDYWQQSAASNSKARNVLPRHTQLTRYVVIAFGKKSMYEFLNDNQSIVIEVLQNLESTL